MGLSFSVPKSVKTPPSLNNIYKNLESDKAFKFQKPKHGDLTKWAEQGILLLNATLTVISGKPNSHHKTSGWADFTDYVIKTISKEKTGIVFLLWGGPAQQKKKLIDGSKHFILENIHPSPLAAKHGNFSEKSNKNFKKEHFSECNELLTKQGKEPIDWQV